MSYSKKSKFYSKPYPAAALPQQIKLVQFIEETLHIKCEAKTLGEMSKFIDAHQEDAELEDINQAGLSGAYDAEDPGL